MTKFANYEIAKVSDEDQTLFHTRYEKTDSCWLWTHNKDSQGYGTFKWRRAHRLGWMIANKADWPCDKTHARHLCHNPSCVNPDHIVPGSASDNEQDKIKAGRHRNGQNKKVKTPLGLFNSIADAAKAHNEPYTTIQSRVSRRLLTGYEYI